VRDELVERGVDEPHELDLGDRFETVGGHPDRRADDARFREGSVDHPILAELLVQTLGGAEHAAVLADVLAHHQHVVVAGEFRRHRVADGLDQR